MTLWAYDEIEEAGVPGEKPRQISPNERAWRVVLDAGFLRVLRLLMQVPRLPTQKRRGWPYPQLTLLPQETVLNTTSGIRC
nr:hypothetical protein BaRGS_006864 [Batillaria attramentaria]